MPRPKKKKDRARGFGEFWKKTGKKQSTMRYLASCESCAYMGEDGECSNNNVSEFDMVKDETSNRIYCTFWIAMGMKTREEEEMEREW